MRTLRDLLATWETWSERCVTRCATANARTDEQRGGDVPCPEAPNRRRCSVVWTTNLAEVLAASPTVPAGRAQQCLYLHAGTVTGERRWGESTVDEVRIGTPLWLYRRLG